MGKLSFLKLCCPSSPFHASPSTESLSPSAETEAKTSSSTLVNTAPTDTTARLAKLRKLSGENGIDYYIVPSADPHGLEWVADHDKRLEYISGFGGSAGTAIIDATQAHLFVDGRYHEIAAREIDQNWTLERVGLPGVRDWRQFLEMIPTGSKVGMDPRLISLSLVDPLSSALKSNGITLRFLENNLVDEIWGKSQPSIPLIPLRLHPSKFSGQSASEKNQDLQDYLRKVDASAQILTDLSDVAWLLNLRGNSIPFNPLFLAYVFVTFKKLYLFVDQNLLDDTVKNYLEQELKVKLKGYEEIWEFLKEWKWKGTKASWAILQAIGPSNAKTELSYVTLTKSIKNKVELEGFRNAYLRDGVAWVRWAAWLEESVKAGRSITEWEAGEVLTKYRSKMQYYAGLAYPNDCSTAANGALPHYTPTPDSSLPIDTSSFFVVDAGPHYLDGTIDTTRTMHFGTPTKEQKRAFTRVLQGHTAIATAKFPQGTTGSKLDILARFNLWKDGLDYMHGTGHGVGSYLTVHEAPVYISSGATLPLEVGQGVTNEPGYYKIGHWGIRTESFMLVKEWKVDGSGTRWLAFENVTQVPIDTRLVERKLMTNEEWKWLQEYNQNLCKSLLPRLKHDKRAIKWLQKQ